MKLQSLIPFGKVRWRSQSINTKQLFVPMALIGICLVGTTPASAAFISFSEDPNDTAPIAVTTDIPNVTITTSLEEASLFVGSRGPFQELRHEVFLQEAGGGPFPIGSDELRLTQFNGPLGQPVGFLAEFFSNFGESDLGGFGAFVPETGNLQRLTSLGFSVMPAQPTHRLAC